MKPITDFILKNYRGIALVIVGAFLAVVLLRKCDQTPKVELKPILGENKPLLHAVDSLKKENEFLKVQQKQNAATIDSLKREKVAGEKLMARADKELKKFIARAEQAKASADTSGQLAALDSLKEAVIGATDLVGFYQSNMDALIEAMNGEAKLYQQEIAAQKAEKEAWKVEALDQKAKNVTLTTDYNDLAKKHNKLVKRHKGERSLSRALAAFALFLGGALIIK